MTDPARRIEPRASRRSAEKRFRSTLLPLCLVCAGGLIGAGDGSGPRRVVAQSPASDAALDNPDVFRRELLRRARGSHRDLALSIRDAIALRWHEDAQSLLESLENRELSDAQRAMMADVITLPHLLRVAVQTEFSEQAKEQARLLTEGKRRHGEAPERIDAAIQVIGSGAADLELPARRTLLAAGVAAVGPLVMATVDESDRQRREALLRVLARLGQESLDALAPLAIYGEASSRRAAIDAMLRLRGTAALPHLVSTARDPAADQPLRDFARQQLAARYGGVPTAGQARELLLDRLAAWRDAAGVAVGNDAVATLWSLDDDGRVIPTRSTAELVAARRVADITRLIHRLGDLTPELLLPALSADLAYRFQLDPLALVDQTDELLQLWGPDSLSAENLAALVDLTLDADDLGALVAALTLVDASTPGRHASLISGRAEAHGPLVRAVSHPVPQVRYEAAAAIGRLNYQRPYPGSSQVADCWLEMARLQRDPVFLLVETRPALEASIERAFSALGYRLEVATSVTEAVQLVSRGGDMRGIVSTSILADRSVLELVDAVRRQPWGRRIPILIHGPLDASVAAATDEPRWETPQRHIELPVSLPGWGAVLEGLVDIPAGRWKALPPLTGQQRSDYRRQAAEAMARVAASPRGRHVYDFTGLAAGGGGQLQPAALSEAELQQVAFGDPRLALLSATPSRAAQSQLVDLLLRPGANDGQSKLASEALRESFRRHGVRIDSAELRRIAERLTATPVGPRREAIAAVVQTVAARYGLSPVEQP